MSDIKSGLERNFTEEGDFLDAELIRRNHMEAALLAKKGVKVKRPMWDGPIAS